MTQKLNWCSTGVSLGLAIVGFIYSPAKCVKDNCGAQRLEGRFSGNLLTEEDEGNHQRGTDLHFLDSNDKTKGRERATILHELMHAQWENRSEARPQDQHLVRQHRVSLADPLFFVMQAKKKNRRWAGWRENVERNSRSQVEV
jgi:hypothetical protein